MTDAYLGQLDTDIDQPVLSNQNPAPGELYADNAAGVAFDLIDLGAGLDPTSVKVFLNGAQAYNGGSGGFQLGFSGSVTVIPNGYHFVVTRTVAFPLYFWVHVEVQAGDLVLPPNVMTPVKWLFRTRPCHREVVAPRIGTPALSAVVVGRYKTAMTLGAGQVSPPPTTFADFGGGDGFVAAFRRSDGLVQWVRRQGGTAFDSSDGLAVFKATGA